MYSKLYDVDKTCGYFDLLIEKRVMCVKPMIGDTKFPTLLYC